MLELRPLCGLSIAKLVIEVDLSLLVGCLSSWELLRALGNRLTPFELSRFDVDDLKARCKLCPLVGCCNLPPNAELRCLYWAAIDFAVDIFLFFPLSFFLLHLFFF